MSSDDETTAYFDSVSKKYGTTQQLIGLGQGAWILKNNDVVVRKDYKVLLVDVHGDPGQTFASVDERVRRRDQHRGRDHGLLVGRLNAERRRRVPIS